MDICLYLKAKASLWFLSESSRSAEVMLFNLFIVLIILFLVIDLGYFNKDAHKVSTKSALYQSIFWILISCLFGLTIYWTHGEDRAETTLAFFSCYLTEKALSVDNIFVILMILKYFKIDEKYYHKILFWGILGAIIFRGIFIFAGTFIVAQFHWVLYIFGAFLIYSGFKVYFDSNNDDINPENNMILKVCRKYLPIVDQESNGNFIVTKPKFGFTSLFLVLILIETTDLIFAMDSIPAIFTITQNNFLIYTSNIFAVLGLRAMFFLLSGAVNKFHLLHKSLSFILLFIGAKMLAEIFGIVISTQVSFMVILLSLVLAIIFSLVYPKKA